MSNITEIRQKIHYIHITQFLMNIGTTDDNTSNKCGRPTFSTSKFSKILTGLFIPCLITATFNQLQVLLQFLLLRFKLLYLTPAETHNMPVHFMLNIIIIPITHCRCKYV